jgi:hypothetical protein
MIRERLREGIALAKKAGVYTGRKPSLTRIQIAKFVSAQLLGRRRPGWRRNTGFRGKRYIRHLPEDDAFCADAACLRARWELALPTRVVKFQSTY